MLRFDRIVLTGLLLQISCAPCLLWSQTGDAHSLIDSRVMEGANGRFQHSAQTGLDVAYLPAIGSSSHAPNLIRLRNGDVLLFWYTGTWEGESGVEIVMSRLPRGSEQWTAPQVIDRKDGFALMNPVAFQDLRGTVHLYHTVQPAGRGQETSLLMEHASSDNGSTWSEESKTTFGSGVFTGHSPLNAGPGRWLLPLSFQTAQGVVSSEIDETKDQGRTWKACPLPGGEGKMQPSLVAKPHGGFAVYVRSKSADFIYQAESADGCMWSKLLATRLPNNNSSVEALVLKRNKLIMAFNNSAAVLGKSSGSRKPLSVALSTDGGAEWSSVRDLETGRPAMGAEQQKAKLPGREEYSFPTMCVRDDGSILVAYNFRRQTIKVARFKEKWLRGTNATEGVFQAGAERGRPKSQ